MVSNNNNNKQKNKSSTSTKRDGNDEITNSSNDSNRRNGYDRNHTNDNPSSSKSKKNYDSIVSNGFKGLGLSDGVYRGIVKMGFKNPTPVQRKAIPVLLTGVDTVVMARTGSGKTIAFLIPLLEKLIATTQQSSTTGNHIRAIILSPTRELSQQTLRVLIKLLNGGVNNNTNSDDSDDAIPTTNSTSKIRCVGIHGAESMEKQFSLLSNHPDVIVATPGRLAHHLSEIPDFHLHGCTMCILDEADRLLEMGFATQIRQIVKTVPESCQKVLLSATMPRSLIEFTKGIPGSGGAGTGFAPDPAMVRLDQDASVSAELRIAFITCRSVEKDAALLAIMDQIEQDRKRHIEPNKLEQQQKQKRKFGKGKSQSTLASSSSSSTRTGLTLIFAATRHHVEYIAALLQASGYDDDVTMIYGTLDQDARKTNLHQFKNRKKSILVVTDVAARGIDVPLIDHVVHYHFPSSAKLFVHRSGRAARAGRIGFCWSLVEPDEMPYMIDLHVFLGRTPSTTRHTITTVSSTTTSEPMITEVHADDDGNKQDQEDGTKIAEEITYTLDEMTPEMVHYGSIPETIISMEVENVQRILNSELCSSKEAEMIKSLSKVCANAMKQYRKTRPEASRDGVRRAKAILEGERLETGQRIGFDGSIPSHPLLREAEIRWYKALQEQHEKTELTSIKRAAAAATTTDNNEKSSSVTLLTNTVSHVTDSIDNMKKREEFLRAMSNFRPKETIFEAFATGKGKDANVSSQVDKGRTVNKKSNTKLVSTTAALSAMKDMRRQMRIARDKGSALVVAGTQSALNSNGETMDDDDDDDDNDKDHDDDDDGIGGSDNEEDDDATQASVQNKTLQALSSSNDVISSATDGKRRLSKAERKRLKSSNDATVNNNAALPTAPATEHKAKKLMRGSDFRDTSFFIENDVSSNSAEAQRSRQIELSMQPSSSNTNKGSFSRALRMEEAMLDIVGDENEELVKRQRMMRWDKSKRRYVQTTVGSELSGDSKSKKLKLESGQIIKSDKVKLGELYEKWQKKTNRSVGRTGVFDDDVDDKTPYTSKKYSSKASNDKSNNDKDGSRNNNGRGDDTIKPMKSSTQIRKEREGRKDNMLKNMKKEDRRRLLGTRKKNQSNSTTIDKSKLSKAALKSSNLTNRNGSKKFNGKPTYKKKGR